MNGESHPSARRWFWAGVGLTLVKLWLVRGQAIYAIGPADHDDRLFLQLADHLLHGDWLGPYNQLTLAKGPFYSCWIAFVYLLGLPLFFAQHVLYAAACAVLVRACRPAIASAAARFWMYALLLCNPISFDASSMGRVLRQHVYGPLALLMFAALIALYLRRAQTQRRLWPWAGLLGFAFGCFWLTREESIWIVPSLLLLACPTLLAAWRVSRAELKRMGRIFAVAGVCGALPLLIVSGLNYHYYRWFGTVEYRATAFTDAYGAMLRVRVGPTLPFVSVTRETRAAIYRVSPAFAELRPFLDGGIGRDWAESSEFLTHLPASEHQIGNGWMMWALRDSVAAAGHGQNAKRALKFYRQMADEINRACDDGRLPAGPPRGGFLPPWREGQTAEVARTFVQFADFTVSFRGFSAYAPPSVGTAEDLELFARLTREKLAPGPGTEALLAPDASDIDRTEKLQRVGRALRPVLLLLFWIAQSLACVRAGELVWRRRGSFPLTVAAAAWGAGVACLLINALVQVTSFPVLVISSFAPVYPLVLLFIAMVFWDVAAAWIVPRLRVGGHVPVPALKTPAPALAPLPPAIGKFLPWFAALLALAPLVIWHAEFAKLFWFGDDFLLLDQINRMGFGPWLTAAFTESFTPVFKLLWGGMVFASGGSYFALIVLLWLTHALNTLCLGGLLRRAGFTWFVVVVVQLLFALPAANLETLGWSVQWSAVLAMTFFLLGLWWQEKYVAQMDTWQTRVHGPLLLFATASACSFSRGVLTGAVLALGVMLSGAGGGLRAPQSTRRAHGSAWLLAALLLLPSAGVTLVIMVFASGNQQHLGGHSGAMLSYAAGYFLLNPGYLLLGLGTWQPVPLLLLAAAKLALIYWGLARTSGRPRILLALLIAYDLGNAVLLGIGRYHTGFETVISSRYNYSSLLATLPFAALWLEHLLNRFIARVRVRQVIAVALLAGAVWFGLQGWPRELASFTDWRGTGLRKLLADPAAARAGATVPALEFMRTERAMELIQRYNLH